MRCDIITDAAQCEHCTCDQVFHTFFMSFSFLRSPPRAFPPTAGGHKPTYPQQTAIFTAKHRHRTLDHHQADLFDRRISLCCHVRRADQVRRFCKRAFRIKPLTHKNIQARAANNIVAQRLRQVLLITIPPLAQLTTIVPGFIMANSFLEIRSFVCSL